MKSVHIVSPKNVPVNWNITSKIHISKIIYITSWDIILSKLLFICQLYDWEKILLDLNTMQRKLILVKE